MCVCDTYSFFNIAIFPVLLKVLLNCSTSPRMTRISLSPFSPTKCRPSLHTAFRSMTRPFSSVPGKCLPYMEISGRLLTSVEELQRSQRAKGPTQMVCCSKTTYVVHMLTCAVYVYVQYYTYSMILTHTVHTEHTIHIVHTYVWYYTYSIYSVHSVHTVCTCTTYEL